MDGLLDESSFNKEVLYPIPPPSPSRPTTSYQQKGLYINRALQGGHCSVGNATRDLWDRMFDESYGVDVVILTEHGGKIYGHASILGMASQVLKNMLKKSNGRNRKQSISIRGVPHDAVRVFIRYLYSSCYAPKDVKEFALHLLVLSHAYTIPHLKRECERHIEKGQISIENVVDVFQLALLCDAPRLSFVCHRNLEQPQGCYCDRQLEGDEGEPSHVREGDITFNHRC